MIVLDINYHSPIKLETYIWSAKLNKPIPVILLYDTGASGLSLSKSFLSEHGFELKGKMRVDTANNRVLSDKYLIPDFWILGEDFGDVEATACSIYGLDDLKKYGLKELESPGYDGLIGMKYIRGFNTEFDFDGNKITFIARKDYIAECISKVKDY